MGRDVTSMGKQEGWLMTLCNNVRKNFQLQGQEGMFSNINNDRYNHQVAARFVFNPDEQKCQDNYNLIVENDMNASNLKHPPKYTSQYFVLRKKT